MNIQETKSMLLYVADEIIKNKQYLTEIDSRIGDGDHGIGMEIGFRKVIETITPKEYQTVNDLLLDTGMAMLHSMGGASGVIFSTIFMGGFRNAEKTAEAGTGFWASYLNNSLLSIKNRGKAQIGDKTMVDAFEPACLALKESAAESADFAEVFREAEEAARAGMESTKEMRAKFGRAKSLMGREIGYQDPGATSVYLMFRAMREWAER